ncbi:hypothetical protein [Kribbella sp. NPDC051620]
MTELRSAEELPGYLVQLLPESAAAVEEVRRNYQDDPAIRGAGGDALVS